MITAAASGVFSTLLSILNSFKACICARCNSASANSLGDFLNKAKAALSKL